MAANKTLETDADVDRFVESVGDPAQRDDARTLIGMMSAASGAPPKMWGPSIIGFGSYHYRYGSGREGTSLRMGFSPRKGQTVLYLNDESEHRDARLARLGKHKTGKSCIYIKRLSDVDAAVLDEMLAASVSHMASKYPET